MYSPTRVRSNLYIAPAINFQHTATSTCSVMGEWVRQRARLTGQRESTRRPNWESSSAQEFRRSRASSLDASASASSVLVPRFYDVDRFSPCCPFSPCFTLVFSFSHSTLIAKCDCVFDARKANLRGLDWRLELSLVIDISDYRFQLNRTKEAMHTVSRVRLITHGVCSRRIRRAGFAGSWETFTFLFERFARHAITARPRQSILSRSDYQVVRARLSAGNRDRPLEKC